MTDFRYRQTYKTRAEATELLLTPKQWNVSTGKFYPGIAKFLAKQGKTAKNIELSDLLNYREIELKIDATTGQSLIEIDHGKEIAALDLEEKKLKIDKLKREGRKDDADYKHIDVVNQREAAIIRRILTELEYRAAKDTPALLAACKGDPTRQQELSKALQEMIYGAFRPIYENSEIDIAFEDEIE